MEHYQESTDRLIGQTLDGRFRVDRFIASGGMGAVYRGTQLSVDKPVAIKVLHDRYADEHALERFMREAQNISKLSHPNIVSLIDFGRSGETTYLVMEYIDGVSLGSLHAQMSIYEEALIELLLQTSAALAEAHAQGIIHRDLKPDNLLLVRQASGAMQVKLVDFGIARTQSQGLTGTGHILGTPWYMSPEQAMNQPLDARADLFSLGVIAFELITGRLPFEAAEPLATLMLICNQPTPPLVPGAPGQWPDELLKIVERLLSKDPNDRFKDALSLLEALEQVRGRHHIGPLRLGPKQSMDSLFTLSTITSQTPVVLSTTAQLSTKQLKPFLAVLSLAIVVMLGIIGYMLTKRQGESAEVGPVAASEPPREAPNHAEPLANTPPHSSTEPVASELVEQARTQARQQLHDAAQAARAPLIKQPSMRPKRSGEQAAMPHKAQEPSPPTQLVAPEEKPPAPQPQKDPLQERLERLKNSRRE